MSSRVSIVILNYNTRHFLEKFLPGVLKTNYSNFEVVVADNASTDDSVEYVTKNFPQVSCIQLSENYGYAAGYNRALENMEADFFVLLNSDVEVEPGWLSPLVKLMETDPNIAAVQPKLIDWNNRTLFEYAGGSGGFIDRLGYPFCRGRWFNHLEKDLGQYNDVREIFWATGACFMVRRTYWKEMGGLDEDFFAHMEEIDLCWRLKNKGYKIMVCPESTVYHVGGGTLPVGNPKKTYLNFRNGLYLLCKNLPRTKLFSTLFVRMLMDGLAGIKFLTEFKFREIIAILKAHFVFYSRLRYWLKKRKMVPLQKIKPGSVYRGSIVVDFYLRGRRIFSNLSSDRFE